MKGPPNVTSFLTTKMGCECKFIECSPSNVFFFTLPSLDAMVQGTEAYSGDI